jgi:hypothetical protein
MRTYFGFCDPSGGSSDSMTLAIAHRGLPGKSVLDGHWERRPPFSPDDVAREFSEILRAYRITKVSGDRYAAGWVVDRFRDHGIVYQHSELTKSEIYAAFVALLNSGRIKIPGDARLRNQFLSLERRASRSGKESIDHLPASHDDCANAVAGALVLASAQHARKEPHVYVLSIPRGGGRATFSDERYPGEGDPRWWHPLE